MQCASSRRPRTLVALAAWTLLSAGAGEGWAFSVSATDVYVETAVDVHAVDFFGPILEGDFDFADSSGVSSAAADTSSVATATGLSPAGSLTSAAAEAEGATAFEVSLDPGAGEELRAAAASGSGSGFIAFGEGAGLPSAETCPLAGMTSPFCGNAFVFQAASFDVDVATSILFSVEGAVSVDTLILGLGTGASVLDSGSVGLTVDLYDDTATLIDSSSVGAALALGTLDLTLPGFSLVLAPGSYELAVSFGVTGLSELVSGIVGTGEIERVELAFDYSATGSSVLPIPEPASASLLGLGLLGLGCFARRWAGGPSA